MRRYWISICLEILQKGRRGYWISGGWRDYCPKASLYTNGFSSAGQNSYPSPQCFLMVSLCVLGKLHKKVFLTMIPLSSALWQSSSYWPKCFPKLFFWRYYSLQRLLDCSPHTNSTDSSPHTGQTLTIILSAAPTWLGSATARGLPAGTAALQKSTSAGKFRWATSSQYIV